jgi:hypothetical protein
MDIIWLLRQSYYIGNCSVLLAGGRCFYPASGIGKSSWDPADAAGFGQTYCSWILLFGSVFRPGAFDQCMDLHRYILLMVNVIYLNSG